LEIKDFLRRVSLTNEILFGEAFGPIGLQLNRSICANLLASIADDLLSTLKCNSIVDAAIKIVYPFPSPILQKIVDPLICIKVVDAGIEPSFGRSLVGESIARLSLRLPFGLRSWARWLNLPTIRNLAHFRLSGRCLTYRRLLIGEKRS
jgi:hypothetical protein